MRDDPHMFGIDFIVGNPDITVRPGGNPGAFGNAVNPGRSVNMQRAVPPTEFLADGAGHRKIKQPRIMVGMIVRENDPVDMPHAQPELCQPDDGPATAINQQLFIAGLDQRRGAKGIDLRVRDAGTKKGDAKNAIGRRKPAHRLVSSFNPIRGAHSQTYMEWAWTQDC